MSKNIRVRVWLDEFDQLIMCHMGTQAVVPESDAGSTMDELFSEDDVYELSDNVELLRSVPLEEYEYWLPTGEGHVRNPSYEKEQIDYAIADLQEAVLYTEKAQALVRSAYENARKTPYPRGKLDKTLLPKEDRLLQIAEQLNDFMNELLEH